MGEGRLTALPFRTPPEMGLTGAFAIGRGGASLSSFTTGALLLLAPLEALPVEGLATA